MTASRIAIAAAAPLLLLAGCDRPGAPSAPVAAAVASPASSAADAATEPVVVEDTLVAGDPMPRRRGGAFGVGIRPTGSTANGISP